MRASPSGGREKVRGKNNKLSFRADGLSLLPSALRPGLLARRQEKFDYKSAARKSSSHVAIPLSITALILGISFIAGSSTTSAASITLTVPSSPLSVNLGPDKPFDKSAPATVSVKTDSMAGYRLTISSKNEDNKLKGEANELVSLPDDVMTETKTGITEDEFSRNPTYTNNWGYQPSKLNGESNSLFIPGPKAELTVINTTKGKNIEADTYTFAIAAKTDSSTQNGTYSNTFVLCGEGNGYDYDITYDLQGGTGGPSPNRQTGESKGDSVQLASETPTKENSKFMGWCSVEPTGNDTDDPSCTGGLYQPEGSLKLCSDGSPVTLWAMWKQNKNMQNWTGCSSLSTHQIVELTDSRDNNKYKVSKLKDGKCWMIENLRIAGKTITSEDSNVSGSYTIPQSDLSSFSGGSTPYNYERVYVDPGQNGGYYSWQVATAGTGSSYTSDGQNAPSSICPKGWRLPTGDSNGDFTSLNNSYGGSTSSDSQLIDSPVPGFIRNGIIAYDSGHRNGIEYSYGGRYWSSSTCPSSATARYLQFKDSFVTTDTCSNYRHNGMSLRCIKD